MADLDKLVEELSSLTVMEAANLKTLLEDKWGVTAASGGGMMMMAGVAPAATAAPVEEVEEKTEFDVILKDVGPKKIEVIKTVRALNSALGLAEAKALVEGAPATLLEAVSKDTAADAKTKLEASGAVIEIK
jgi:large subunit ribosomal protein L7/L12